MLESIVASLDGGGDAGVACLLGELWAGFGASPRDRALPLADFQHFKAEGCPKDVGSACWHSPTRLRAAAFDEKLPSSQGEQIMFTHQRPLIRFEILAIISICGLLFVVAFREAGHPLWAIPAMTLFLLSGMMFVYALSKASRRLLQGPQETTLAVP